MQKYNKNGCYSDFDRCKNYNYIIFTLFLIATITIWFTKTNQLLFLKINSLHKFLPTIVWQLINLVSYSKFFILPTILLLITLIWRKNKFFNILILIIVYFVIFGGLKLLFSEARPYIILDHNTFYWLSTYENVAGSAYRSYPSGHVGNMGIFAFTISLLFFKNRPFFQFLMLLLVIITGLSRICTGWHWPLDVLTSGLISYVLVK